MGGNARQRFVFMVIVLMLVIGGAGVLGWTMFNEHRDLQFTVLFEDAKQLQTGQPLIYQGVKIGEVADVKLGEGKVSVLVSVDTEHARRVYREAIFKIERSTPVFGERQLTMKDRDGPKTQIVRGDTIAGTEGFFDEMLTRARGAAESLMPKPTNPYSTTAP